MRFTHIFENIAALALVVLSPLAITTATAQTIISNEALVTTNFIVSQKVATAKCQSTGCSAKTSMFAAIPVTCPAATGQTCTFHIALDTKTSIVSGCGNCGGSGGTGFYQFLVDDAPPTIGPTTKDGNYLFEKFAYTAGLPKVATRQSYPASVLTSVTNSTSNIHTILVNVGCSDANHTGGCSAVAYWTTMRVDVFEP